MLPIALSEKFRIRTFSTCISIKVSHSIFSLADNLLITLKVGHILLSCMCYITADNILFLMQQPVIIPKVTLDSKLLIDSFINLIVVLIET